MKLIFLFFALLSFHSFGQQRFTILDTLSSDPMPFVKVIPNEGSPLFTDIDTTSAVSAMCMTVFIVATLHHAAINGVDRRSGHAMRRIDCRCNFSMQATARLCFTSAHHKAQANALLAAITFAVPQKLVVLVFTGP
jgi:hypothetical protein